MSYPKSLSLLMITVTLVGCGSMSRQNPAPPVLVNSGLICPKPLEVPSDLQTPYAAESLAKMRKLLSK